MNSLSYRPSKSFRASLFTTGYTLVAILLVVSFQCHAGSYLLVKSGNGEIYSRFESSLKTSLTNIDTSNTLVISTANSITSQASNTDLSQYDAIISAGIESSRAISKLKIQKTIFMALVPRNSFNNLSKSGDINCHRSNCHVIFLGQPANRQLQLIKLAFPDAKQIAVIGSKHSNQLLDEIAKSAPDFGFTINRSIASDENSVLTALNRNLTNADVLMAIPDPVVFNRNTARAILLSAFHQHIPLFAYSNSFVRAGAVLGIYSSPEDIANHVADLLSHKSHNPGIQHKMYPKYFTISINLRAAEALDITLPDAYTLEKQLKAYEN